MSYVFIALTILFTVYGQLIIKYEIDSVVSIPTGIPLIGFVMKFMFFRPLVISGLLSAVLASMTWIAALSKFELSYAYPFISLNFVAVVGLSFLLFGEGINAYKLIGLALICLGVFVVGKGAVEPPRVQAADSATLSAITAPVADRDGPMAD
jgi:drug/metabolite transporter (DMT)-like permease